MSISTRDKLLAVAMEQFAARGFSGVSIASIADALGLSKQALLHHFSSKEKLYGELLHTISLDFEARIRTHDKDRSDLESLVTLLVGFARDSRGHRQQTVLLVRELLDNSERASEAGRWYLKPFLESLIARIQALPEWAEADRATATAAIYQILGAINYFAISRDTLTAMFGSGEYERLEAAFDTQLNAMIRAALETPPETQTTIAD